MNTHPQDTPSAEQMLDQALTQALTPPALPEGFRWKLMAAMQQATLDDIAQRRAALEAEHQRLQYDMQQGYVRVRRDTLVLGVALAFASGAVAAVALPWLQARTGLDAATLMPTLATLVGAATAVGVWWWRLR
ncbi:MAG: hypothetical protein KA375_11885 [Vitreoscilla sp.]|mgnify:FL=1|nr:hypothetical protein [Burkholderiales bacterium]MBP6338291.1 hypothetical protein [Vitreoscilla sp.]MBP6677056.1 hypothetical protein [Vitreoscilla sp.]